MVPRYSRAASKKVGRAMRERKKVTSKGESSGKKSNEPLAGYRNRPLRGVMRWEESSKEGREEECQT